MVQNVIFDFGNVLAHYDPEALTAACVADPEARRAISEIVFDRQYWDRLDAGTITDEEVKAGFCSRLPAVWHREACLVYDRWIENLTPMEGMRELLLEMKSRGGNLFLLSNIGIGFTTRYQRIPWLAELFSLFDGLVFSGPIGMVKPHREIYQHLLARFELAAQDCVFIDDSPANIAGAAAVGIDGILFTGDAAALRQALLTN